MNAVLAARARIIAENQQGGHDACRGCSHLVTRDWQPPSHPVGVIGIAQFTHCNIECNYCYLQTQDPESFAAGANPYEILPALRNLIQEGHLAPNVVVDWGGGEPTIYREFDEVLELITNYGGTTWVHTNGTRLPRPVAKGLATNCINILCSVDAGTANTWKRIKAKDLFETVWRNLEQYIRSGCRVALKYIMKDENCSNTELHAFVRRAVEIGAKELVLDIDYDFPDPNPKIIHGLQTLHRLATARGIYTTFGSTGAFFTPEIDVAAKLKPGAVRECFERLKLRVRDRLASANTKL